MSFGLLAPLTLAALTLFGAITRGPSEPPIRAPLRIVDVRGAAALVARGATVLDARDAAAFSAGHLPGAQNYTWQRTTGAGVAQGRLRPDLHAIAQMLAALGIDIARPALVYGSAGGGQGEEGHAAWLLLLLGHPDVAMLDGGFAAWRNAGRPVVTATAPPRVGRFEPRARSDLRAARDEIPRARQILDVRSAMEFAGATPFGEARGGHLANAKHLDWRALLDETGRVRPAARIHRLLADAGIDPQQDLVTCCSNGVRSGFATAVLNARGVPLARTYDGGLIEWAADPTAPLVR
jgi:thiosulfate/3-mercaptopyruvate sulfurtransferase